MRKIRFRAWLKNEKKMVDVDFIEFDRRVIKSGCVIPSITAKTNKNDIEPDYRFYHFENVELMQFTGLYDKNGIPIYEGDIVRVKITQEEDLRLYDYKNNITGYICYDAEYCLFYLKDNFMQFMNWAFNDEIEVIGNIYENKELLGEKKNE